MAGPNLPTESESHVEQLRRLMRLVAQHLDDGKSPIAAAVYLRSGAAVRYAKDVSLVCETVARPGLDVQAVPVMSAAEYSRAELAAIAALREYDEARAWHSKGSRPPVIWLDVAVRVAEALRGVLDCLQAAEAQRAALELEPETSRKDVLYLAAVMTGGLFIAALVLAVAYLLGVRP